MRKVGLRKKLSIAVALVTVLSMLSCVAAIPLVIMKIKEENQTRLVAEMPAPPEKVFGIAVEMAQEKNLEIKKKEVDKRYLEVTDGVQTASLKAEEAGAYGSNSKVTIIASISTEDEKEKKKAEQQELAQRIMNRICERLKVQCTIEQK